MATIAVIIPCFNQGSYLEQAIRSVLSQTYQDFEVLVVDDGSTDDTPTVMSCFSDGRLRYVHQDNRGLAGARNTGIRETNSSYLIFLDADDWLLPEALELHIKAFSSEPRADVSIGGWFSADATGRTVHGSRFPPSAFELADLVLGNAFPVHSAATRRSCIIKAGFFDETLRAAEDWDLWLRMLLNGCKTRTTPDVLCAYRMHGEQMTRQAQRMRTASLSVLDKFFSHSNVPSSARDRREHAYALAHLRASAREYAAGDLVQAKQDLLQAVVSSPSLLSNDSQPLTEFLAGWALDPRTKNPFSFLETLYDNLPEDLTVLRKRRRRDLADMAMSLAWQANNEQRYEDVLPMLLRGIREQPRWLANKGVCSLLVRSMGLRLSSGQLGATERRSQR